MRRRRTATRKRKTDREKGPEDPPGESMRAPLEGSSAGLAMFQSGRCAAGRRSRAAIVRPRTSSSSSNLQQRLHVSTRDEMRSGRGKERERETEIERGHNYSLLPGTAYEISATRKVTSPARLLLNCAREFFRGISSAVRRWTITNGRAFRAKIIAPANCQSGYCCSW